MACVFRGQPSVDMTLFFLGDGLLCIPDGSVPAKCKNGRQRRLHIVAKVSSSVCRFKALMNANFLLEAQQEEVEAALP